MQVMFQKVDSQGELHTLCFENVFRVSVFMDTWEVFLDNDFAVLKRKEFDLIYCAE